MDETEQDPYWMLHFIVQHGNWIALLPEPESSDLAASSFLMIPYSNRIAGGSFRFAGQQYQLAKGENHAIHGDVRKRPWVVIEQRPACAKLLKK